MQDDSLVRVVAGKLGSGKTFYAVIQAVEALARQEVVVSNVKLNWPAVDARLKKMGCAVPRGNVRFVPTEAIEANPDVLLEHLSAGSMLILDEVHLFLSARKWSENQAKAEQFMLFLTQARKLKVDVWLISQSEANIDSMLTRMATHIVRVTNWLHLPFLGKLLPLPLTIAKICQPDGKSVLSRDWVWRSKKIGNLYDTLQTFKDIKLGGAKAGKVRGRRKRKLGYGWTLMTIGAGLVLFGRWRDTKKSETLAELEALHAGTVTQGEVKPKPIVVAGLGEGGGKVSVGGARSGGNGRDGSTKATPADRARIESMLPEIYKVEPFGLHLKNFGTLLPGVFFVAGPVIGWEIERGGTVLVNIESENLPQLRLWHDRSRAIQYDYAGGLVGRSVGSARGSAEMVGAPAAQHPQALTGTLGDAVDAVKAASAASPGLPATGQPAGVEGGGSVAPSGTASGYSAPQAFVPSTSGPLIPLGPRIDHVPVTPRPPKIPAWPASARGNVRP